MNIGQFNRILLQTLLLPVLALTFVALILVWNINAAQNTVATIQKADESITAAIQAEKFIVDEETALRGYQLTADKTFLAPYRASEGPFKAQLDLLRHNLEVQHESTQLVDEIKANHDTWRISFAEPLIGQIATGGNASDVEQNLRGKNAMDKVRGQLNQVLSREDDIRKAEAYRWKRQTRDSIILLVVLALGAGAMISIFSVSWLHRVSAAYQDTLEDLRRQARATFESEERLRTTLTSIGDGVVVCDASGRVELLNTVAQQLTGWTQEEAFHLPLKDIFKVVSETTREPAETPVARVLRINSVAGSSGATVLLRRDESELHIDASGAPIYDRVGMLSGIVMVFRDISHERRAQTALLAAEKLAVAGRLAATIAHEIHNPLDSVVNLLYLIDEEKDADTSAHYLSLAQEELARMGQVSRAMLGLYREANSPVTVNVKDVLDSVLVLLDRQLKDRVVQVDATLPTDLQVEGFPAELRQVFTNLVANAADASSPGDRIRVTASRSISRASSGARPGVSVTIADTGSGIEPEALKHIFDPFFTTKGESGTGIGLWVSRGIVEKHGGTIDIRSKTSITQHGTSIKVFLPFSGPASAGV